MRKLSETASQWNEPSKHAQEVFWLQCQGQKMWGGRNLGDKGAHAESNKNCNQSQQLWWYPTFPGEQTNPSCAVLLESNCRDKNKMCPQTTQMQTEENSTWTRIKNTFLGKDFPHGDKLGVVGTIWAETVNSESPPRCLFTLYCSWPRRLALKPGCRCVAMTQPLCKPCSIFMRLPTYFFLQISLGVGVFSLLEFCFWTKEVSSFVAY